MEAICVKVFYSGRPPRVGEVIRDGYPSPCVVSPLSEFVELKRMDIGVEEKEHIVIVSYAGKKFCFPRDVYERVKDKIEHRESILLLGPPGTGKSTLAEIVARSLGWHVVEVTPSKVFKKYVGESEQAIESLFAEAEAAKRCVLLIDEGEYLLSKRSYGGEEGYAKVHANLVNMMLRKMQEWHNKGLDIIVVVASNAPVDMLDPAFLRYGRFGDPIVVPPPPPECVKLICKWNGREISDEEARRLASMGVSAADLEKYARTGKLFTNAPIQRLYNVPVEGLRRLIREYTRFSINTGSLLMDLAVAGSIAATLGKMAVFVSSDERCKEAVWLAQQTGAVLVLPPWIRRVGEVVATYRGYLVLVGSMLHDTMVITRQLLEQYVKPEDIVKMACTFSGVKPPRGTYDYVRAWREAESCLRRLGVGSR